MIIEDQTEAQRKRMSRVLRLFEGRTFVQPVGSAPRFISQPSVHQMVLELVRSYRAGMVTKPEIKQKIDEITRDVASLLAKFRQLREAGYVEPPGSSGIFEGVLKAQHVLFRAYLHGDRDTKPLRPGRKRDTLKPILALQCRSMLECFGIQATSGPTGNVAVLASGIHFLATGRETSMERAAALAMNYAKLNHHLDAWQLTE